MSQPFRRITRRTMLRGVGVDPGPSAARCHAAGRRARRRTHPRPGRGVHPFGWRACTFPTASTRTPGRPRGSAAISSFHQSCEPLSAHKNDLLVLTNLMNRATDTGDGHYVKTAAWLTGTTITRTTGSDLNSGGISMDQLAASRIGHLTPLPSLELGVEPVTTGVDTNVGYTRLYGSHISWSTPTTPLAKEINPKLAFDRLFRSGPAESSGNIEDDRSMLDLVIEDAEGPSRPTLAGTTA